LALGSFGRDFQIINILAREIRHRRPTRNGSKRVVGHEQALKVAAIADWDFRVNCELEDLRQIPPSWAWLAIASRSRLIGSDEDAASLTDPTGSPEALLPAEAANHVW